MTERESKICVCKQNPLASKLLSWLPVLGWMIVIFCFSAQPNSAEQTEKLFGDYNFMIRKFSHMAEYGILALLSRRAWNSSLVCESFASTSIGALIAIAYAITDEWHQSYVPGRSASIEDVFIDSLGVVSACVIITAFNRLFRNSSDRNE